MRKVLIISIIFMIFVCLSGCAVQSRASYYGTTSSKYITVYEDENEGFTYKSHVYRYIQLDNYEYLVDDSNLESIIQINYSHEKRTSFGYNKYPYNFINDSNKVILFDYRTSWFYKDSHNSFETWSRVYIRDDYEEPIKNALVNKIELKINGKEDVKKDYTEEEFSNLFIKVNNIDFIWNKEDGNDDLVYVDVYIGICYVSFYNHEYKRNFKIKVKIYEDKDGNYYTKCGKTKTDDKKEPCWYRLNLS